MRANYSLPASTAIHLSGRFCRLIERPLDQGDAVLVVAAKFVSLLQGQQLVARF